MREVLRSIADIIKLHKNFRELKTVSPTPTKADGKDIGILQRSFHCYHKDKYGLLLLAGCDSDCKFRWADISHPSSASDYTA
jgi:hypothetical protein